MFTDNQQTDAKYHGYNPKFAKRARDRRRDTARKEREAEIARSEAERKRKLEEQRLAAIAAIEAEDRARADKLAKITERNVFTGRDIARAYVASHGLLWEEVASPCRQRHVVNVRHGAICAVRDAKPNYSLKAIGLIFGLDHTTVLHALRKAGKATACTNYKWRADETLAA